MTDALEMLVKNIVQVKYDVLPIDTIDATKKQVLDILGTIVAGSSSNKMGDLVVLVKEWGGKEESTILGYGGRVPSPNAALVNGTLACCLDYDDTNAVDAVHVSRATVPASFAMAEHIGVINGKDFITAIALGFDLSSRLSRATGLHAPDEIGWDPSIHNFFGAAASASKLLNLDEEKLTHALGIALEQISSGTTWSGFSTGATTKGMVGGFEAKAGIIAALLAERGFTSGKSVLEGQGSYYSIFWRNNYSPELLTLDLGKDFRSEGNGQKPYPCCLGNHATIDATLAMVKEHDIKPDDVVEVTARVGPMAFTGCSTPLEEKQRPRNSIQSQFSIPWAVANAILYRKVGLSSFTEKVLQNKTLVDLACKVHPHLTPEFGASSGVVEPVIVEIRIKGGQTYAKRVDYPLGSLKNPLSLADVAEKFTDCCNYSVKPIPQENRDEVVRMVANLEDVTDVSQIVSLLV
jgi:2-methylcitrate dehydratase PrpD